MNGITNWDSVLELPFTGGEKADCQSAPALLAGQSAKAVIADKDYDTNEIRAFIRARKMKAVIPAMCNRKHQYHQDKTLYAERNRIERCFGPPQTAPAIATRFDRNDTHFLGFLYLACAILWLN